ncbi:MAG: glycosyltransferase [Candidatus Marinimicrobia bacterium]|nr:glycosyltransferase [Candidatus Neomarinimicrobiota bacterium]
MNSEPQLKLRNEDIVLISNQMLEDRYLTSKQYITQEIVKSNRVLYVEANYSFGKLFLGLVKGSWPVHPFGSLRRVSENLWVLTPLPRLPLRNHLRVCGWLNQSLLRWKIRSATKKLEFHESILWTFLHQTAELIGTLGEKVSLYHCVDDWPALLPMAGMGRPARIIKDENELLDKVDIIFRVSQKLLADRQLEHKTVVDIPNGVDTNLFRIPSPTETRIFEDLNELPEPIIGFSGSVGNWVDVSLFRKVAEKFSHCSVVLIGLNEKNPRLTEILNTPNIHFLGMKKREDVPHYLAKFDVCLMPFDKGQIGEGLLPLKMFEYLALGRPIVTISSKTMETFEDVLYCADDHQSFLNQVGKALNEGIDQDKIEARVQRAQEYSWQRRVELYGERINRTIAQGEIHAE